MRLSIALITLFAGVAASADVQRLRSTSLHASAPRSGLDEAVDMYLGLDAAADAEIQPRSRRRLQGPPGDDPQPGPDTPPGPDPGPPGPPDQPTDPTGPPGPPDQPTDPTGPPGPPGPDNNCCTCPGQPGPPPGPDCPPGPEQPGPPDPNCPPCPPGPPDVSTTEPTPPGPPAEDDDVVVLLPGMSMPTTTVAPEGLKTIVEIAVENGNFETLVAALTAAGLVEALSGDGPFTVLAPNDDAFAKLPAGTVESLLADIPTLSCILTSHVILGNVPSADVTTGPVKALSGHELAAVKNAEGVFFDDAKVIAPDIEASNGVIHVIDSVIVPKTCTDPATPDEPTVLPATTAATAAPPLFAKSAKSKTSKASTKSAKSKTLKDPMAKVAKSASDAKAEKVAKASKAKSAKSKSTKASSSKGSKLFKQSTP